MKTNLGSEFQ